MVPMFPACTPQSIRMCAGPVEVGTVTRKKSPKPIRYMRTRSIPFTFPPPPPRPLGGFARLELTLAPGLAFFGVLAAEALAAFFEALVAGDLALFFEDLPAGDFRLLALVAPLARATLALFFAAFFVVFFVAFFADFFAGFLAILESLMEQSEIDLEVLRIAGVAIDQTHSDVILTLTRFPPCALFTREPLTYGEPDLRLPPRQPGLGLPLGRRHDTS